MTGRQRRWRRIRRGALVAFGLLLLPLGVVGVLLPTHLLGGLLILGLILVLRNSPHMRRRFILAQRRHPRLLFPVRRVLRGEVIPVLYHEFLRTERWLLPRRWRRLRRLRRGVSPRTRRRAQARATG